MVRRQRIAAGGAVLFGLAVLAAILFFHARGGEVAPESLRAMAFRTMGWLALFAVAAWRPPSLSSDRAARDGSR